MSSDAKFPRLPDEPLNDGLLGTEPHTRGLDVSSQAGYTGGKPPKNLADAMLKALRPKQWVKNVLVVAAPVAAGSDMALSGRVVGDVVIAFVAFCLAASSVYLINDAKDVDADRAHPTKRFRPIAAGVLPVGLAYAMAVILIVVALALSFLATAGSSLAIVVAVYLVLQLGYCFGWKHQPVIDIALVSSGFMLRTMAGGVAAGIVLSQWFLIVAAFGSLFMAGGKRYAEFLLAERTGAKIRKALEGYTATYLRFVWQMSATCVIMAYALWGFQMSEHATHMGAGGSVWYQISMVPFTVAIMRYASDVDRGDGGAPDEIALRDRVLQFLAACWLVCIALAVYVVPMML